MKFLTFYLWQRRWRILTFILFCAVFLCAFLLYDLPIEAVFYPAAVCIVLGACFLIVDINRAWRKHQRLTELSQLPASLMERFPPAQTQDDMDYQTIIDALRQEQNRFLTDSSIRYADMMDYYTLWAHQIKTPISSMRLTLQNEDSELSRQLSQDLFRIEQYVEMVLAFLRLESDASDYLFREYDLDDIIRETIRKLSSQFIRRKIRLSYEPVKVRILTDEKWLSFVIEQLLSNALKYTPAGGSITIDLEEPLTLCIRDTGIGIAPEDLPRIFEKGYTGYNGRSDKKASGIGLYLCKCACNRLGHRITAQSSLDSGTVMRVCLQHQNLEIE